MKQICKYLGYFTAVLGVIGSFALAKAFGVEVSLSAYSAGIERDWLLTVVYFVSGLFCTAILSSILLGIYQILEHLEKIHTKEALLEKTIMNSHSESQTKDYWTCPRCGRKNPPYTGTCGCGHEKP